MKTTNKKDDNKYNSFFFLLSKIKGYFINQLIKRKFKMKIKNNNMCVFKFFIFENIFILFIFIYSIKSSHC